jgi:hypothetical protein
MHINKFYRFSNILFTITILLHAGYPSAAINTKQAGECTAQFLMGMEENNEGFKAENVHAIGFSLGAHVASFASKFIFIIHILNEYANHKSFSAFCAMHSFLFLVLHKR